jgi:hypothetical protein
MICAVHALIGAAIGKRVGKRGGAFACGIATHLLGDLLPHKDFDPKIEAPLLAATLGVIALRKGIMSPEFLGALGGIAPDFENAAAVTGLLPADAMIFPTHQGDHHHGPKVASALPQGIIAAVCAAYLLRDGKA